ncbi:MAG: gliding motility-associated ABC transporter ATP-binding subunit GldA [Bacteroidales bacterium]|jgi:ABC-2 type transport system ATP-binding protein|nr:gliding motility-associated ABC transporter ATP-binding subunit GldA [Bacteroidales bacterium]MDD2203883.1 gliding motility-associated ABC transporter ATP-binding subunit GldA [Bacteroidales bacterium]MDD3152925.1 gliding motility-associated ABC transporter ATP-binding subunit GldA [Bacteroidales bacterium]MDD3913101.1 gliding motility-associated ABC transporter ATP-binding subunit GldA [Bacteroidales bacterium]MDD4633016.1 gliding motility-associated ABC transporter ATP-binding subunit GldA
MSVTIEGVTKLYGSQKALDNVSIHIDKGEVVGLLGPNGAGKSTLMKIITCYLKPTSGTADVCGHDILESPLEVKKHIGYLQENNPLYSDMYIAEYLDFISEIYHIKKKKDRIKEIIELTGLTKEQNKLIRELSKGYKQRVGLAQALIHDPEVLILDEPTTGLDPNQLTEMRRLIKELGKNKTVLLSTHIMQEVEAICDRVIIINNGKIIANSKTEEILAMQNMQSIEIELKKPYPSDVFKSFPYEHKIELKDNLENSVKYLIHFTSEEDLRDRIFNYAKDNGLTILSMGQPERHLEEIFINLVNKE